MAFAVSLRRSRWWLYTKAYILGAMVSFFTATPVSSRIPSAPAQIQQQLTRLQALRENVQREETRFRDALSRAGISTAQGPNQSQQDGGLDLEQGLGPASSPATPTVGKPWAIERALGSLGERAQAEAKQRQQHEILQEPLVESPISETELGAFHGGAGAGATSRPNRQRSSTAPSLLVSVRMPQSRAPTAGLSQQPTLAETPSRSRAAMKRWTNQFQDLRNIRKLMSRDEVASNIYPEVDWDAQVRKGNDLSPLEVKFLEARVKRISTKVPTAQKPVRGANGDLAGRERRGEVVAPRSHSLNEAVPPVIATEVPTAQEEELSPLHRFLGLPASEEIHPDDVPIVSLGGSGGGYRAKFGFAAFIAALETGNAWQVLSYVAGVSGSCWTIAELYTHARLSPHVLLEHYKRVAAELAHPLSLKALNIVANTRHGVYFLLAPLLRKAQSGVVGLGIMDLYATMTTCYQFLPRPVRPPASISTMSAASQSQTSLMSNEELAREHSGQQAQALNQGPDHILAALSRTTFQWSKTLSRAHLLPANTPVGPPSAKEPRNSSLSVSAAQGGAHPLPILTAVRVSYADPNPSFLVRKAGIGRRGPIEDDFEREELPQYKAQSASEEDVVERGSGDQQRTMAPRRSLAYLEGRDRVVASPTGTPQNESGHLARIRSEPSAGGARSEAATALELELEKERGGLPHPYDELIETRTLRAAADAAREDITGSQSFRVPRLMTNTQAGPNRSAVTRTNVGGVLAENLTPQERLQRARVLLIQSRRQRARAMAEQASSATGLGVAFQWFEISPIEVGSSDVGAWVPTWSFGRTFLSGRSLSRQPEASLSLLLGQCTSAPAGPLTGYIAALLASLPAGWTLAASLLGWVNTIVRAKRWERRWGNPIRAADEPNPFYGLNLSNETAVAPPAPPRRKPSAEGVQMTTAPPAKKDPQLGAASSRRAPEVHSDLSQDQVRSPFRRFFSTNQPVVEPEAAVPPSLTPGLWTWEASGRIKLMDSGLSNNLPSHVLMHPGRNVDIIIAFDASSDVQKGAAIQRIHEFGRDRGLRFRLRSDPSEDAQESRSAVNGAPSHQAGADTSSPSTSEVKITSGQNGSEVRSHSPHLAPNGRARSEGSRTMINGESARNLRQKEEEGTELPDVAEQIRAKFEGKYAQVLDGWRVRSPSDPLLATQTLDDDWVDIEEEEAMFARDPDVRMIYCPLLPSARIPDFDPSTSAFSTSYNLVWTPDQVETLAQCSKFNVEDYVIDVVRQTVREVYESKKRRRLAASAGFSI
ncbi:unnamed protein product [Tilletia controversa]|uniref:Lysophospholipase n=1 Tax=Tilletia caries TaxID=13290 RepID=A0A177U6V3_9BASI|nr:hypothetical protein CF336_g5350 [Tilletia laevis]KAE8196621.1 hypothetical protein CF335_g4812 [Tilletia laevis]KAE8256880.1 hypothetical protein A4X03_0g4964 [Tilletia caries]CAD6937007.1 unnamed protein product [Tilletia caries]CAD6980426.1 unnamed protein product [Tilletia controversa]